MKKIAKFDERLSELMFQANNITSDKLGEAIGIGGSTIRLWKEGKRNPFLSSAIKLADYFKCSLDFLFGRSETVLDFVVQPPLSIYDKLLSILEERGISRYRMVKDAKFPKRNFESWRDGRDPLMQTVIDVANYLEISIDYLVGRER